MSICDQTAGTTEMFCRNSKSFRAICEPSFTSNCNIRAEIKAAPLLAQSPDSKSEQDRLIRIINSDVPLPSSLHLPQQKCFSVLFFEKNTVCRSNPVRPNHALSVSLVWLINQILNSKKIKHLNKYLSVTRCQNSKPKAFKQFSEEHGNTSQSYC